MNRTTASAPDSESISPTRRVLRAATAVASTSGFLVGLGAVAASPAFAATATDCIDDGSLTDNTLSAPADDVADIQVLLDADTAIVCLSGTFTLNADSPLEFDHDLTVFGLDDAVLDGNDASQVLLGFDGGDVAVQNLTIRNGSSIDGAAVRADHVTAIDSHFENNSAQLGGAISAYTVEIVDSTFVGNSANFDGGAIIGYSTLSIESSTFVGNTAGAFGGAVRSMSEFGGESSLTVTNTTFVDNEAGDEGGAIFAEAGAVLFSTFLNNTAAVPALGEDLPGEAIYLDGSTDLTIVVRGNIFAGSTGYPQLGIGSVLTPAAAYLDFGGNVFSTSRVTEADLVAPAPSTLFSRTVTSIFGPNPQLGANGGSTPTLALVSGSPAIDAVPALELASASALQPAALADADADQRGVVRTGLSDAGSFEFGDAELAATGSDAATNGWLAAIAAMLLGSGVAAAIVARRRSRTAARSYAS